MNLVALCPSGKSGTSGTAGEQLSGGTGLQAPSIFVRCSLLRMNITNNIQ